ncbi:MAG: hypothetical protein H6742_14955 [Alphaproteobacteria bacterium]|nr:hypothetical protein [Alphaproteobacteria bacterium]
MRRLFLLPLLVGCTDYSFTGEGKPGRPEDTGELPDPIDSGTPDIPDTPGEEECNGVDDDGDGEIDEGYPDTDLDGIKDCLDDDCSVDDFTAFDVTVDEDCLAPDIEVLDPWNVGIEWQYTVPSGTGAIVMPAIGNLTDDNGDGFIDENDNPDIVISTWSRNTLVALHGDGSGVIWEVSGFDGNAGVAIADVDNDGEPEVIAGTTDDRIASVSHDGTIEWRSNSFAFQSYPQPTVADLDGDGDIEVIMDIAIVEGSNGTTVGTMSGLTSSWRAPVVADIDGDGTAEILLGEICYDHFGLREWSVTRSGDSTFQAVANIDRDPEAEVFWVTGNQMHITEADGTLIRTVALNSSSSRPGPPSVADFDGDGQVEIVVPASRYIEMFEVDGTKLWQATIQDNSGIAGASGYDINGDGAYEVLYADEISLRIFDGTVGTELYSNSSHSSGTVWEYPTVADVDNDGSAEIVIASNGSVWKGISVLGHVGEGWAKSGTTWPVHDWAMTQVEPDGHVPSPAPWSWDVYNVFRARPTVDDAALDLQVQISDVCFSGCTGESEVEISVQIRNHGGLESRSGLFVSLYAVDGAIETFLDKRRVPEVIPSGRASSSVTFTVTKGDLGPDGFVVRADDDGTGTGQQNECDERNNFEYYSESPC